MFFHLEISEASSWNEQRSEDSVKFLTITDDHLPELYFAIVFQSVI